MRERVSIYYLFYLLDTLIRGNFWRRAPERREPQVITGGAVQPYSYTKLTENVLLLSLSSRIVPQRMELT